MFFTFSTKLRNPPIKPPVKKQVVVVSNKYKCSSCTK